MNHEHAEELNTLTGSWHFMQWAINLVGPLKNASRNRQYLFVATYYFSKWIEVEPLIRITAAIVKYFIGKNIICRFEIPYTILIDNRLQFTISEVWTSTKNSGSIASPLPLQDILKAMDREKP